MIVQIHYDPPSTKYGTGNFIYNLTKSFLIQNLKVTNICYDKYECEKLENSNYLIVGTRHKKRYPLITYIYELIFLEISSLFFVFKNRNKIKLIITYGDCGVLVSIFSYFLKIKKINYFFVLYKDLCFLRNKEKKKQRNFRKNKNFKELLVSILNFFEDNLKIFIESIIIKIGNHFLTASTLTKKRIKKKVELIYYFHNFKNFKKEEKNKETKQNILLIGNDLYLKGLVRFASIVEKDKYFYQKHCNINILGVSNLSKFENILKSKKLSDIIKISGHKRDIKNYNNNCDIFVNLSFIEGWNISLLDCYLNKKIIFTTKVGCVNEILLNNCNVITCDKKNDNKLSQKLKKLILEKREFTADNRYFEILEMLSEKKLNQEYLNLFENIKKNQ